MAPARAVIVAFRTMAREVPRTLHTCSPAYQRYGCVADNEAVAVDIESAEPLDERLVQQHGPTYRHVRAADSPSPTAAINAARSANGAAIAVCIDGVRMLSPGVSQYMLGTLQAWEKQ